MCYYDVIVLNVRRTEVKRAAIRFEYEVVNTTTGRLATEGSTWHVLMGEARKAMSIPADLRELFEGGP